MNVIDGSYFDGSYFLDSNIWIYALSIETEDLAVVKKRKIAVELIQHGDIFASFQVVNEVCTNAIKKLKFTDSQTIELIQDFYSSCTVIESSQSLSTEAAHLRTRYRFSFWDSFIVAAAIQADVPTLYSEDMQNGLNVDHQLQIVNPLV